MGIDSVVDSLHYATAAGPYVYAMCHHICQWQGDQSAQDILPFF